MVAVAQIEVTRADVERALADADVPVLLMVLVHLTGERKWIEEPYRPERDMSFFAEESGGLPEDIQLEVKDAACQAIVDYHDGQLDLPIEPSEDLYAQMMDVCVGQDVPDEYVEMMLEEMGLRRRDPSWRERPEPAELADLNVLIVGAGMSGICAAAKLEEAGIAYTVIEKNERLGGTWYENTYPEVGCDVPNHFYSFSFRPNPDWTGYFSKGEEIETYLEDSAIEFGITERIRFSTEVVRATYDETRSEWQVELRLPDGSSETQTATVLVSAVGQLNRPKLPKIDGLDSFEGPSFHTAQWDHDVDLRGKRVAVIGTGASSMQLARTTADVAERLLIFQRSPQWAIPSRDYHRSVSVAKQWLLNHVPYYARWYRFTLAWRFGDHLHPTIKRDPDWPHPDRAVNKRNDRHREFLTDYIVEELGDRVDLLEKVLPDYPPYGKRILVDNEWFRTVARDDVDLITSAVARVTPTGVITESGEEHEVDVIVLATGFEATRLLWPMDVRGRDGQTIREVWGDDDSRAHLGLTVPGFPNLFCLYGPNTNLGHGGSIVFIAECQVRYLLGCLMRMVEDDIAALECTQQAYEDYNTRLDDEHAGMIWTHPGMDTWYRNQHGRVVSIMPWRLVDYWQMTREPDMADFDVIGKSG
ncbi:MAG: flavin-containing monooxygenase [Gaiellaceae bacterium]